MADLYLSSVWMLVFMKYKLEFFLKFFKKMSACHIEVEIVSNS